MGIWEKFRREAVNTEMPQSTLVVVGDKGSGKSSIISRIIEQNSSAKATIALEYLYAKKDFGI
jgi:GTPase SAR1 family protein